MATDDQLEGIVAELLQAQTQIVKADAVIQKSIDTIVGLLNQTDASPPQQPEQSAANQLREWLGWAGKRMAGVPQPYLVDVIEAEARRAVEPPLPVDPDAIEHRLLEEALRHDGKRYYFDHPTVLAIIDAARSGTEPGKPTALSRTDPPRCDECGRVGYIVGVGADLRIGGHLDQQVKHPFRSGTEPGE